jgi:biotin carboxylase
MRTILCIATYLKGEAFLRECRAQGCRVLLLTADTLTDAAWPRESIDEIHAVRRDAGDAEYRRAVDAIARRHALDGLAALDDFDVETAAMLREHLQMPGIGRTTASRFRDKLAMRVAARHAGLGVPDFTAVFNDQAVADWAERVPPPWVLKPRSFAAAIGIKKIANREELWRALEAAGDKRAECVLERFVHGDVYHVDSIVWNGDVVFSVAFKYGRPPMEIAHQGGIFVTKRLPDESDEGSALLDANRGLQAGFGLGRGVSHTEFIRDEGGVRLQRDQHEFLFLETSARVGGAFIADTIEAATGINLWREWARIEIAGADGAYAVPAVRRDCSAIVLSLARQAEPDMSSFTDPEIVVRIRKAHHAGLIVASPDPARIDALIADYTERYYRDFFATAPPPDRPTE